MKLFFSRGFRVLAFLISFLFMSLCFCMATFAYSVEPSSEIVENVVVTSGITDIKRVPTDNGDVFYTLDDGAEISVSGAVMTEDQRLWFVVDCDGKKGFILSNHLIIKTGVDNTTHNSTRENEQFDNQWLEEGMNPEFIDAALQLQGYYPEWSFEVVGDGGVVWKAEKPHNESTTGNHLIEDNSIDEKKKENVEADEQENSDYSRADNQEIDRESSINEQPNSSPVLRAANSRESATQGKCGWYEENGKRYFAKEDGTLYYNMVIHFGANTAYYMGEDGSVQIGVFMGADGIVYATDESGKIKMQAGWELSNGKRYFNKGDGTCYVNTIITFGSNAAYYMGADGSAQTGHFKINGIVYSADDTGLFKKQSGWETEGNNKYFNKGDATCYSNKVIHFGSKSAFYLDQDGVMVRNRFVSVDNKSYFAGDNGEFCRNQFVILDGETLCYVGNDGSAQTDHFKVEGTVYSADKEGMLIKRAGWESDNNDSYFNKGDGTCYSDQIITFGKEKAYYLDPNGVMAKDRWINYKNKRYFARANGLLYKNQFISFGPITYYMGSDGSVSTGHFMVGDIVYSADETGLLIKQAGWETEGDNKYFNKGNGICYTDQIITFGKEKAYYLGIDGVLVRSQWINHDSKRYFPDPNGLLYRNQMITFGSSSYYMGADWSAQTGHFKINGTVYSADTNGLIIKQSGWETENGKKYFNKGDGTCYYSTFISFGSDTRYYMDADGAVKVGTFTIDGIKYVTDSSGKIIQTINVSRTLKGVDVSAYQGSYSGWTINWSKVKAAGIDFAIIRVGGRFGTKGTIYVDDDYLINIKGALNAGLDVGVYFFSQAITEQEAIEEADFICDKIRGYNITLPVVYDTEYLPGGRHNNLTRAQRTKVAKAFCDRVLQRGYTPMIYASTSWLNNDLDMSQLSGYKIWVAQYYSVCQYTGTYEFWQYTSSGSVNGINGDVDMNYWYTGGRNN